MKKILVLPIKNEEWILESTLACASLWADHIIVADQNSEDSTPEILKKFSKVLVIKNNNQFHSSNVRKLLLDAARNFDGNNAIFSFDADEIPTSHILEKEYWDKISSLNPGSAIEMQWVNLWRSPDFYRTDEGSMHKPQYKSFGFIDNRKMEYTTLNVVNDHTSRIPAEAEKKPVRFEFPKVLHYQFANWQRTMSKQAYYRVVELLQKDNNFLTHLKINLKYLPSKDERGLKLEPVPNEWFKGFGGLLPKSFPAGELFWQDLEVLRQFEKHGTKKFSSLDIWDVDWESKRKDWKKNSNQSIGIGEITDARSITQKFFQKHILPLLVLFRPIYNKIFLWKNRLS